MKRPRPKTFHLPVAFTEYKVRPVARIDVIAKGDASGTCDLKNREIMVARGTSTENWRATLWHEWSHAFFHEMGRPELCNDEALIEAMAISIMLVRVRAPDL